MDEFIDFYSSRKKVTVEIKKPASKPEVKKESVVVPEENKVQKVVITESTKEVVEEELGDKLENLDGEKIVEKVNKTKKAHARRKKNGEVEVKGALKG